MKNRKGLKPPDEQIKYYVFTESLILAQNERWRRG